MTAHFKDKIPETQRTQQSVESSGCLHWLCAVLTTMSNVTLLQCQCNGNIGLLELTGLMYLALKILADIKLSEHSWNEKSVKDVYAKLFIAWIK